MKKELFPLPQKAFALGVTSYVLPASLVCNIEFLTKELDEGRIAFSDIEILFFESHKISPLPKDDVIEKLLSLSKLYGYTYTIHLPLDLNLGTGVNAIAAENLDKLLAVWKRVDRLKPFAYILHCKKPDGVDLSLWQKNTASEISKFSRISGVGSTLCVENIDYPFSWIFPVIERLSLSICMDTGHLLIAGENPLDFYRKYFKFIRVCHAHGTNEGKDHKSLDFFPKNMLKELIKEIRGSYNKKECGQIVFTLELFSWEKVKKSFQICKTFAKNDICSDY